jgi:hypothetical protein
MQPRPTNGPLKLDAHRLKDKSGNRVYLLGAIICCGDAKERGWPLIDEANLDLHAEHGANYTHIRLGPNSALPESPDRDHTGYGRISDTVLDLNTWDPTYWERVANCVEAARQRGTYVEVSLIDVWTLKHQALASAWWKEANKQHFNLGTTAIVNVKPHARALAWVRKVVDVLGAFDNVLWLDGNEVFDAHSPDPTAWVTGLHDAVRERETERGFKHHLFGTNSHVRALRFLSNTYEAFHTKEAVASAGRPVIVNEYSTITPLQYKAAALDAVHKESSFMAWKGGQTNSQWQQTLENMAAVRDHVGF